MKITLQTYNELPASNYKKIVLMRALGNNPNLVAARTVAKDFVQAIVNPKVQDFIKAATQVAADAADATVDKFFNWIGHNFMGPNADGDALGVYWKPLSDRYVKYKRASGFWLYTLRLQRQFYARSGLKAFGKTQSSFQNNVEVNLRNRSTMGSSIQLTPAPLIAVYLNGGNMSLQDLDSAIFKVANFDQEMVRKLEGKKSYYRPLVGAALALFLNDIVPAAVQNALNAAGYKNNTRKPRTSLGAQYGV